MPCQQSGKPFKTRMSAHNHSKQNTRTQPTAITLCRVGVPNASAARAWFERRNCRLDHSHYVAARNGRHQLARGVRQSYEAEAHKA
jgi:hypothetical protein